MSRTAITDAEFEKRLNRARRLTNATIIAAAIAALCLHALTDLRPAVTFGVYLLVAVTATAVFIAYGFRLEGK